MDLKKYCENKRVRKHENKAFMHADSWVRTTYSKKWNYVLSEEINNES